MKTLRRKILTLVGCGLAGVGLQAATVSYDFNTPLTGAFQLVPDTGGVDTPMWRATKGVNNSGYVSLFDAVNSKTAAIMFPDFDSGLVVKAFTFECDLRVGNARGQGDGRPADGFSISYARANDPVVADMAHEPPVYNGNNYSIPGAPEGGVRNGLSICFDTWSGNSWPTGETDIEGVIVRVDNVTVAKIPMTTRNGACTDATSLQTGPWDGKVTDDLPFEELPDLGQLCWARLKAEINDAGEVTVTWKGTVIANKVATGFAPSAGRIVLAGRTGGANENTHIDNVSIVTVPATSMIIGRPTGNAFGFTLLINDSGLSQFDPTATGNLTLTYDGNVVPAASLSMSKAAGSTKIIFTDLNTLLPAGSSHTVAVSAKDTLGATITANSTYTIPGYTLVSATDKITGTPTVPGMKSRTYRMDVPRSFGGSGEANWTSEAEMQLAGGYTDPTDPASLPYPNTADPIMNDVLTVNWDQAGTDIDAGNPDNFNSVEPVELPVPNEPIPGVSVDSSNDNIVVETITYLQLAKGIYSMGVNSDDGFKVSVAPGQPSVKGTILGEYSGGRGASDTIFEFVVAEDGFYPVRLLWWEGNGGGNCEWFSVDRTTGEKTLINGTSTKAIKAYRDGVGRTAIKSAMPSDNWPGGTRVPGIRAELIDGTATVVDGSVKLWVNGKDLTSKATIVNGTTTTITFKPTDVVDWGQTPNWRVTWTESTTPPTDRSESFTFRLAPDDLPVTGAFWIEAEDWDYQSGQTIAAASEMPYYGAAYDGLAGVLNVDYFDDQNDGDGGINFTYRTDQRPNHANVTGADGGRFGKDRPGTTDLMTNYRIGWVGNFWGNYTRTVPPGVYTAYAYLSVNNSNVDGTSAILDKVTAGVGTTSQTTERLGTFRGRGNGGWGSNELAPLERADRQKAYFKVAAGNTTFKVTAPGGDFDAVVLVKANSVPPQLKSAPDTQFTIRRDAVLTWTFEDFSLSVNAASIKMQVNGADVAASDFKVTKVGDITTVTYDPAGLFDIGKTYTFALTVKDSAGGDMSTSGSWIAGFLPASPANMFVVEAEDFNTGGGQAVAGLSDMPYKGNAYNGLAATVGVDYFRDDSTPDGNNYRLGETPNVPHSVDGDLTRAQDATGANTWTMDVNYRLGWSGGGRWMNYTRNVPAGQYQVWASLGHGDGRGTADRTTGNLRKVTSDPTKPSQTTETVGMFRGPATGGWGTQTLVPMRSAAVPTGDAAVVSLGGNTTFQYEYVNGDFDYFILVPVGEIQLPPEFTSIKRNTDGSVTLEWTGGGTLEAATSVQGPWQAVTGATSPYTFTPTAPAMFGRIKKP
jgi:hypothetical protein